MNTPEGAKKSAETQKLKYGNDHYVELGKKGGKASSSRPFSDPDKAREAALKRWQKDLIK